VEERFSANDDLGGPAPARLEQPRVAASPRGVEVAAAADQDWRARLASSTEPGERRISHGVVQGRYRRNGKNFKSDRAGAGTESSEAEGLAAHHVAEGAGGKERLDDEAVPVCGRADYGRPRDPRCDPRVRRDE
jgi:hypothetical protein